MLMQFSVAVRADDHRVAPAIAAALAHGTRWCTTSSRLGFRRKARRSPEQLAARPFHMLGLLCARPKRLMSEP